MADESQVPPEPLRAHPALAPRRRHQPIGRSKPEPGLDKRFSRSTSRSDDDEVEDAPSAVPLRERRFSRSGTVNGEDKLNDLLNGEQTPAASQSETGSTSSADEGGETAPSPRLAGRVAPRRTPSIPAAVYRRKLLLIVAAFQAFAVVAAVLGFVVGWLIFSDRPKTAATDEAAKPATGKAGGAEPAIAGDYALQAANTAIKTQLAGDFTKADQLFTDMKNQEMILPGLNYRLALLALVRLDFEEVRLRLARSIREGEEIVPSQYALASIEGSKGNYTAAAVYFDATAHLAPFHALPFFCWAECLRRDGKMQASMQRFDEALNRPLLPDDAKYIRFKRNLTRVESGNDADFRKEIADKLTQPNASGDVYMLAAAVDIQQGAFPAAADHLNQAAKIYPPEEFALKIADYFYQAQSPRPALTAILAKRQGIPRVDPGAWGIMESDPATWPAPSISYH